jgi:branched-chain amino acid transport system substrate-binding protein
MIQNTRSTRRRFLATLATSVAAMSASKIAFAADPLKIGLILPLTGPFASTGKQIEAACRLYIAKNGDTVRIMETRPLSKLKRWRLVEIVGK